MTAQESCIGRVTQLDWAGLRALWGQIQSRETPGWEQGEAFEYLVLRAFQIDGASVSWPYTVWHGRQAIEQVDGAIASDGLWCLVESKDTQDRVNVEPLAKLRNQLSRRPSPTIGLL